MLAAPIVPPLSPSKPENQLLNRLSRAELTRLMVHCLPVPLVAGQVLASLGTPASMLLFPVSGIIAMVVQLDAHAPLGASMVGQEGCCGVHLVLGLLANPVAAVVQVAGLAWGVPAPLLRQALPNCNGLRLQLQRYVGLQLQQGATAVACQCFHTLGSRLATWLLVSFDRTQDQTFAVTHEALAHLLGVRRVGVTVAAGTLQEAGLISYHRGQVTLRNRAGLLASACSCYALNCDAYRKAFDRPRARMP